MHRHAEMHFRNDPRNAGHDRVGSNGLSGSHDPVEMFRFQSPQTPGSTSDNLFSLPKKHHLFRVLVYQIRNRFVATAPNIDAAIKNAFSKSKPETVVSTFWKPIVAVFLN